MSGHILNGKGLRVGVESGDSIFDLSGKKVYDVRGLKIYRLSGELVGHLMDVRGSDRRLDRDSEGLLSAQGQPENDKPEVNLEPQKPLSDSFAEAIRLRRMISRTLSDRSKGE